MGWEIAVRTEKILTTVLHEALTVTVPVAKKPVYAIRTSQNRC